jgi:hypothetical protein
MKRFLVLLLAMGVLVAADRFLLLVARGADKKEHKKDRGKKDPTPTPPPTRPDPPPPPTRPDPPPPPTRPDPPPTRPGGGGGGSTPTLSPEQKARLENLRCHNAALAAALRAQYNAALAAALRAQYNRMLIDYAWMLINDGKLASARSYLNNVIKRFPTEPAAKEARKLLAVVEMRRKAADALWKQEELAKAANFVRFAKELRKEGKGAKARGYLQVVLKRWPTSPAAKEAKKLLAKLGK